jgi:hypothetical protein
MERKNKKRSDVINPDVLIVPSWNGKLEEIADIVMMLYVLIVPSWNGKPASIRVIVSVLTEY